MAMTASDFAYGKKAHVEFDGTIEEPSAWDVLTPSSYAFASTAEGSSSGGFVKVRSNGIYHYVWFSPYSENPEITLTEPPDWEKYDGAKAGDVWEADGREYLGRQNTYHKIVLDAATYDANVHYYGYDGSCGTYSLKAFGRLNPTLKRRRGATL